ncbi:unnamed protein product [Kuraishia capsulata CBS 1993]|uniref:CNH domain-containing protein n=1 Tax=Kuraishia capsulata CBS 1993 TaxID=1382522 RepID=W6MWV1_9ASCO|nr:uncharacterized protein KUCA_T00003885001 [Kuraishia capsulata CBS 1993]CDK27905.1 unnamed protein product [Kuraishia capsulata CBS 1993]
MPPQWSYDRIPFGSTLLSTEQPTILSPPSRPLKPRDLPRKLEHSRMSFIGDSYAIASQLKQKLDHMRATEANAPSTEVPKIPLSRPPVPKPRKSVSLGPRSSVTTQDNSPSKKDNSWTSETKNQNPSQIYRVPSFFEAIVKNAPELPADPIQQREPRLTDIRYHDPEEFTNPKSSLKVDYQSPIVIPKAKSRASLRGSPEREVIRHEEPAILPLVQRSGKQTLDEELLSLKIEYESKSDKKLEKMSEPETFDQQSVVLPLFAQKRKSFKSFDENLNELIEVLDKMTPNNLPEYTVTEIDSEFIVQRGDDTDDEEENEVHHLDKPSDSASIKTLQDLWESPKVKAELSQWLASLKSLLILDYPDVSDREIDGLLENFLEKVRNEGAIVEGGSKLVFLEGIYIPGEIEFTKKEPAQKDLESFTKTDKDVLESPSWGQLWKQDGDLAKVQENDIQQAIFDLLKGELVFMYNCRKMVRYGKGFLKQEKLLLPSFSGFHSLAFEPISSLRELWKLLCVKEVHQTVEIGQLLTLYEAWLSKMSPTFMYYYRARVDTSQIIQMQPSDSHLRSWIQGAPTPTKAYEWTLTQMLDTDFVSSHFKDVSQRLVRTAELIRYTDPQSHNRLVEIVNGIAKIQLKARENQTIMTGLISQLKNNPFLELVNLGDPQRFWAGRFEITLLVPKRKELRCTAVVLDKYLIFISNDEIIANPISLIQVAINVSERNTENGYLYVATVSDFDRECAVITESPEMRDAFVKVCLEVQSLAMRSMSFGIKYSIIAEREFEYKTNAYKDMLTYPQDELTDHFTSPPRKPDLKVDVNCVNKFSFDNEEFLILGQSFGVQISRSDQKDWYMVAEMENVSSIIILEDYDVILFLSGVSLFFTKLSEIMKVYDSRSKKETHILSITLKQLLSGVNVFSINSMKKRGISTILAACSSKNNYYVATLQAVVAIKPGMKVPEFSHFEKIESMTCPPYNGISVLQNVYVLNTPDGFRSIAHHNQYPIPSWTHENIGASRYPYRKWLQQSVTASKCVTVQRLTECESICVYDKFAIFLDASGTVCRNEVIKFPFYCHAAVVASGVLLAFGKRALQGWWISGDSKSASRICLVRSGQNMKLLSSGSEDVIFSFANPFSGDRQAIARIEIPPLKG